jgi:hypothetical protein
MGRRDKDLTTQIGGVIDERLRAQQPPPSPEEVSTQILERPTETIGSIVDERLNQRDQQYQSHVTNTMTQVANLMDSNPLYNDKDLGNEVVESIKAQVQDGKVHLGVDPENAGSIILGNALADVMRKRASKKVNPLGTNTPTGGSGTLKPPAVKKKAPKVATLDERTQKMAKHWGYSQEDLAKIFPAEEK